VSDQDFFDEDEQPTKGAEKAAPAKKGSSGSPSPKPAGGTEQSVSMTVTALVAVVAVLLGVIVGLFIGRSMAAPAVVVPAATTAPQGQAAPQLSPDQLEGGELPAGHPDISGGAAAPEGSTETTGN
jgi:hypothetical protein